MVLRFNSKNMEEASSVFWRELVQVRRELVEVIRSSAGIFAFESILICFGAGCFVSF